MKSSSLLEKLALEVEKNDSKKQPPFTPKNKSGAEAKKSEAGDASGKEGTGGSNSKSEHNDEAGKASGEAGSFGEKGDDENSNTAGAVAFSKEEVESDQDQPSLQAGQPDSAIVIDFLFNNPNCAYQDFSQYAESNGLEIEACDNILCVLAGKFAKFLRGGKSPAANIDMSTVDPEQMRIGMEVESEHADDPVIQKKIFLDHYSEDADYYKKLAKYVEGDPQQNKDNAIVAEPKQGVVNS